MLVGYKNTVDFTLLAEIDVRKYGTKVQYRIQFLSNHQHFIFLVMLGNGQRKEFL
jgi:hypothetical protein